MITFHLKSRYLFITFMNMMMHFLDLQTLKEGNSCQFSVIGALPSFHGKIKLPSVWYLKLRVSIGKTII